MPKYISGRSKLRDPGKLTADRYRYLGLDQAEPNLGNPPDGTPPTGAIPPGDRYQIVSIEGHPGERYWIPVEGGIIPGTITIYDEGTLVGGISSTSQLNFVGAAISASSNNTFKETTLTLRDSLTFSFTAGLGVTQKNSDAFGYVKASTTNAGVVTITNVTGSFTTNAADELFQDAVGIARTPLSKSAVINASVASNITVSPEFFSVNKQVIFNDNGEFNGAVGLVYQKNGASDDTSVGLASVGIGTTNPYRTLHVGGDLKLDGTIYDHNNEPGAQNNILTKGTDGVIWQRQEAIISGAGGTIGQVQYHNDAGTVGGASNFYFDADNDRVGIGSTIPTKLLDVLGDSIFTGDVTFDGDTAGYDALWDRSENSFIVKDNAKFAAGTGSDLEIHHDSTTSYIDNKTGHLYIRNNVDDDDDGDIYIEAKKDKNSILCKDDGEVILYYDAVKKAETTSNGFKVTGLLEVTSGTSDFQGDVRFDGETANLDIYFDRSDDSLYAYDNAQFRVGTDGDVRIYHDATRSYFGIDSGSSGNLTIGGTNTTTGFHTAIHVNYTSSPESSGVTTDFVNVELWHTSFAEDISGTASTDGSKKFETIGVGVSVYDTAYIPNLITVGVATIDNIQIGHSDDNTINTKSGNLILDSANGTVEVEDVLYVDNTTASTNTTTGALRVGGGAGIAGDLNVGGAITSQNLDVSGIATIATLGVTGIATTKDFVVTGVSTIATLGVTGIATTKDFVVTGVSTIATLGVTGLTTTKDLEVTGIATIATLGVTGIATTKDLEVTGIATIATLGVTGIATTKDLEVTGIMTANGKEIYTKFDIENSGSSAYTFKSTGIGFTQNRDNPDIFLNRGQNYRFDVDASGHPFWIKTINSAGIGNSYNDGVIGNGTAVGIVTFEVPFNCPDTLYYNCQNHLAMNGKIYLDGGGGSNPDWEYTKGQFTANNQNTVDIDTFDYTSYDYKTVEYILHFEDSAGNIQACKCFIMQNNTTSFVQEYAVMFDQYRIVNLETTISGTDVKLQATAQSGITGIVTYRYNRGTML